MPKTKKLLKKISTKKTTKGDAVRHFINLNDVGAKTLRKILDNAHRLKKEKYRHVQILNGQTLAMIFDKPSTRTRVSFETGFKQLGGHTVVMDKGSMQLGQKGGETIHDTSKVLSRMVDAIMIRISKHEDVEELAKHASIPVVNALTDASHPCQIMADLMTIEEHGKKLQGLNVTWLGDDNNVSRTFAQAAGLFGFTLTMSAPKSLKLDGADYQSKAVKVERNPKKAVTGADVVVTDTWVSMGKEAKTEEEEKAQAARIREFNPYQVNEALMKAAKPDAIFMHCLPAHRGYEVTDAVMDGKQSVIFDEAENRLHAQKAILAWCLEKSKVRVKPKP